MGAARRFEPVSALGLASRCGGSTHRSVGYSGIVIGAPSPHVEKSKSCTLALKLLFENTTMKTMTKTSSAALAVLLPLCFAAKGDGCASNSLSPAPDVTGDWAIRYDDTMEVRIRVGGATYDAQVSAQGGVVDIEHNGKPLSFDLDCAKPEIVCPSEAWPSTIHVEQRNDARQHRMIVTLPQQQCDGERRQPAEDECGEGTLNPDCEEICEGTLTVRQARRFGVIGEDGSSFRLYLGAGVATNGINCALLGVSLADAELESTGDEDGDNWRAEAMSAGLVTVAYAGACLWAGDPDMDQELEALLVGASIEFHTGFTGEWQR